MKSNAASGLVPVELTRIEELLLRSAYLQAKLLEQQYFTAREQYMAQFDRRADVRATLIQIEEANKQFNDALAETHKAHGTTTTSHVYDMDVKALLPRPKEGQVSPSTVPEPVSQRANDEGAKDESTDHD